MLTKKTIVENVIASDYPYLVMQMGKVFVFRIKQKEYGDIGVFRDLLAGSPWATVSVFFSIKLLLLLFLQFFEAIDEKGENEKNMCLYILPQPLRFN